MMFWPSYSQHLKLIEFIFVYKLIRKKFRNTDHIWEVISDKLNNINVIQCKQLPNIWPKWLHSFKKKKRFGWFVFYGISTLVGYLMLDPVYTNIYDL